MKEIFTIVFLLNAFSLKAQLDADFIPSDTVYICYGDSVQFTDASIGDPTSWIWIFKNNATPYLSDTFYVQNPIVSLGAGKYDITLKISDGINSDSIIRNNFIKVEKINVNFFYAPIAGCSPIVVSFNASSSMSLNYYWDFGDGNFSIGSSNVMYTYVEPGFYLVRLISASQSGCRDTAIGSSPIVINPIPISDFSIVPQPQIVSNPVSFTNSSVDANKWHWDFGDGTTDSSENPTHIYQDTGSFNVQLKATNVFGCTDTVSRSVKIISDIPVIIPTLITPNGDGFNDQFIIEGKNNCSISIFNVWNEEVYSSSGYKNDWHGTNKNGKLLDTGAYYYILKCGEEQITGVINILH